MSALRVAELPSVLSSGANAIKPLRRTSGTESVRLDLRVLRVYNRTFHNQLSGRSPARELAAFWIGGMSC
jgi:hypothetical protein